MTTITKDDLLDHIRHQWQRLGAAVCAHPGATPASCPEWRGRDLLAHSCGFARYVRGVLDGTVTPMVRGTSSDLLLALWHRRDPVTLYVSGDKMLLERWPHV